MKCNYCIFALTLLFMKIIFSDLESKTYPLYKSIFVVELLGHLDPRIV